MISKNMEIVIRKDKNVEIKNKWKRGKRRHNRLKLETQNSIAQRLRKCQGREQEDKTRRFISTQLGSPEPCVSVRISL